MPRQVYVMTRSDGVRLYKTYSDAGKYIIQVETGIKYEEAIDVYPLRYNYIESEEDIVVEEETTEEEKEDIVYEE